MRIEYIEKVLTIHLPVLSTVWAKPAQKTELHPYSQTLRI